MCLRVAFVGVDPSAPRPTLSDVRHAAVCPAQAGRGRQSADVRNFLDALLLAIVPADAATDSALQHRVSGAMKVSAAAVTAAAMVRRLELEKLTARIRTAFGRRAQKQRRDKLCCRLSDEGVRIVVKFGNLAHNYRP